MPYGKLDKTIENLEAERTRMILISLVIIVVIYTVFFILYYRKTKKQIIEINIAHNKAVQASKAKSDFLSNMSHDIRTPMNAIVGMTALASANIDNKPQLENCLKKITQSNKQLLGLINDILDMSKIENGKMILKRECVSLSELVSDIVTIIQPQIKEKRLNFNVCVGNIETENVYSDGVRLHQVVMNILSNAAKFTPDTGTINLSVYQEPSESGDNYVCVHFKISDNGIGMSEEFKNKIFDSFAREDNKRVNKTEGTGLGMAITKYIVDSMHGKIEVDSQQGVGTEFRVAIDMEKIPSNSKGELLITIMSSLAQEESRSISENVTWGQRKRFADGKVSLPYKHFLGYKRGENGLPEIVSEEAEIIRLIYRSFINGMTPYRIAKILTDKGIPTPGGKTKWQSSTIESILTNEKYKGSALLQKQFTVDFLTKKRKINEGEIPQYYIENSHEAIIPPDEFELVQAEFLRRKSIGKQYNSKSIFAARIVCGDCGNFYGSKVWHSTSKYRRVIWRCNHKFNGVCKCNTPHLYEDTIKAKFLDACNLLFENRDEILKNCRMMQDILTDCSEIDEKQKAVLQEMEVVAELTRKYIMENSQTAQNQDKYNFHYNAFVERYEKLKKKSLALQKQQEERLAKRDLIGGFILELTQCRELLAEFDEKLWVALVERVTVFQDGRLTFEFRNGTKIKV